VRGTAVRWARPDKSIYGREESYRLAASWLAPCGEVADWGAGGGRFRKYLPPGVRYYRIDGTPSPGTDLVADLADLLCPWPGILLRHVIDNTFEPFKVLGNALSSFQQRLAVVTYTPDAEGGSRIERVDGGWPTWNLDPQDLRLAMGRFLKHEILTGEGPERVYCLER
jgi:hypothetical protein